MASTSFESRKTLRFIIVIGMLSAIAYFAMLLGKLVPNVAGFLSYDPKDAVVVIAGFIYGPLASLLISVIVSLVEMATVSSTGLYGLLMNVVSTCAFALPAVAVYRKKRSKAGAIIGLAAGVAVMAGTMVLWNYIITPLYMGVPREQVAGMLATVFLPFNAVKGVINAALVMIVYKPLVTALRKTKLVDDPNAGTGKHRISVWTIVVSAAVLVTAVLLLLVLAGVL